MTNPPRRSSYPRTVPPPQLQEWIQSGDLRRAASSLVVSYSDDVLTTCTAMLRDPAAAEDVTQEVFDKALRALSTFRGDASPRSWLLSIARNLCIDYLRARKREPWGGPVDDDGDVEAIADPSAFGNEWHVDRSLVLRALDALAEGDRALVVLRFKNGLEYDELANAFGLREGTVRMRVSRALARMRQVLEHDATEGWLEAVSECAAPPTMAPASLGRAPPAAARPRAAAAPAPPAARARTFYEGFGGAPAGAAPPPSWWQRLVGWTGTGADAAPPIPAPSPRPIGALGLALTAATPIAPSDALMERLGRLVENA